MTAEINGESYEGRVGKGGNDDHCSTSGWWQ